VQEGGSVLDIVQDEGAPRLLQERHGIRGGPGPYVGSLQGDEGVRVAELRPEEGRLAGLAGPGHQHRRECRHGPADRGGEGPGDVSQVMQF